MGDVRLIVWVDSWQQECCGDPFSVESEVRWTLTDADLDYLTPLFPPEASVTIDRGEERHGGLPDDAPVTVGTVATIHAVQLRYALQPGNERTFYPVPGSAQLTEVQRSDGKEMRSEGFAGYLVEIII